MRFGCALYRLLLHLLPRDMRRSFAEQMVTTLRERHAHAARHGTAAIARLWCRELVAVVVTAGRSRFGAGLPARRWDATRMRGDLRESSSAGRRAGAGSRRAGRSPADPTPSGAPDSRPGSTPGDSSGPRLPATTRTTVMDSMVHDLRYAFRSLRQSPGFTVVAVLALALGIGASTAIFSVVYGVLGALPYPGGERISLVYEDNRGDRTGTAPLSPPEYLALAESEGLFDGVVAYSYSGATITGEPYPESVGAVALSHDFMDFLDRRPLYGRDFTEADLDGDDRVVVLGYELWQRRWLGDESLVGETITVNDAPHTVIGITRDDFTYFNDSNRVYFLLEFGEEERLSNRRHSLYVLTKPRDGLDAAEVDRRTAELVAEAQLLDAHGTENPDPAYVSSLYEAWVGAMREELLLLFGAVGLLLLIACANVANLHLARGMVRRREIATRLAVGASRGRVLQQLITESLLLSLVGGIAGVVLAVLCVEVLADLLAANLPRGDGIAVNLGVLAFTTGVAIFAGVVSGLAPALFVSRAQPRGALVGEAGSLTASRLGSRLGSGFLVVQVALALTLVISAALVVRSFTYLRTRDLGFDPEGVVAGFVSLRPSAGYDTPESTAAFFEDAIELLASHPGVEAAGLISLPPGSGAEIMDSFLIDGAPEQADAVTLGLRNITPGAFDALRIPLLRGRYLDARDNRVGAPPVAVVSERLAREYWPGEDPLGRRLRRTRAGEEDWMTVVGVVGEVEKSALGGPTLPIVYVAAAANNARGGFLLARTPADPQALIGAMRAIVRELDDQVPVNGIGTLEENIARTIGGERLNAILFSGFGLIALLLATVGEYAVFQHLVRRRTAEIGVRVALGATAGDIVVMVVRRAAVITVLGIALGIALAVAAARVIGTLLHGVQPVDAPTYLGVTLLLGLVALLASLLPARTAAGVDPVRALRR